ncbi:uncharacterized protein LOC128952238 [Oppia nitens]|uniref:uncharacterized protein LOC128952238 n=1 Tax=Oppia nitens TaxID=1686743 RepID=UPI0023DAB135|nr:uncharacterized protein LOC128952238 [Oppia nitens]
MVDNLETKLREFRSNKLKSTSRQQQSSLNVSNIFRSLRRRFISSSQVEDSSDKMSERVELLANEWTTTSDSEELLAADSDIVIDDEEVADEDIDSKSLFGCNKYDWIVLSVKVLIYLLLQIIAFLLQFGAVFFSIALLVFICTNLSNRSKQKGELSAYSVFNPNCQPIHGTVSAKDLQNQMTLGALHL